MNFFQGIADSFYKALIVQERWKMLLEGLGNTLIIALGATVLGVAIGIVLAIIKYSADGSKNIVIRILDKIASIYITVIRGTPVMVQLFILSTAVLVSIRQGIIIAIIGMGLNSGAYVAEIIRAGIESVPRGQMEAGRSLGFHYIQTMRYIILPQAVKNILPALGNEFIVMVKETSVISVIAVNDLTKMAQYVGSRTWDIIPPMVIAAVIYLIITLILTKVMGIFERRLSQGDHH